MLDSVCKFIRRFKKSDSAREPKRDDRGPPPRASSGRRNTGRWTDGKPPLQGSVGRKQLPLNSKKKQKAPRKRMSRTKESSNPDSGGAETYEISMMDMENKKETNIQLSIRRPTGCPNKMKRELQKFNSSPNSEGESSRDSRQEGEADIGTGFSGCGGSRRESRQPTLSLNQQALLVVVTNVANTNSDAKEAWYPGKERDDISSDNPYFADEKRRCRGEMNKKLSDSNSPVSSDFISDCDEPGAITIGQRLSDVYDKDEKDSGFSKKEQNFNREDVYE